MVRSRITSLSYGLLLRETTFTDMFCQGGDLEKTRRKNLAPAVTAVLSCLIHRYGVTRHRRCIETSPWIWNNDATGLIMSSIRLIDESNGYKNKKKSRSFLFY